MKPPIDWSTRITARVEANTLDGDLFPGYVVRVYDRDARDPDSPVHDSQVTHGKSGVFAEETEAEAYRDARRDAEVAAREERDRLVRERGPACAALEAEQLAEIARQEEVAKSARDAAKAANEKIKALIREATEPEMLVECAPRGGAWVVMASPAIVDGTMGGAPRVLRRSGARVGGSIGAALDETQRRRGKRKPPPRTGRPPVQDAAGDDLRVGSTVELPGLDGRPTGKVVEVVEWTDDGWLLEIQIDGGEILQPLAHECLRVEQESDEADEWPEAG